MSYGYSPVTHTPEGYHRAAINPTPRPDPQETRNRELWSILHGYTAATRYERKAAYETLKAAGLVA